MKNGTLPSDMSKDTFLETFGTIYEHSPWVAEKAYVQGLSFEHNTADGLAACLGAIVDAATDDQKLTLLRAHPELAGKLAIENKLTTESKSEQAGAGLDKCNPQEFERFQSLNSQYTEKFGFPFIIAVKGLNRNDILSAFERRIQHSKEEEFATALSQVHKIARLRLEDLV